MSIEAILWPLSVGICLAVLIFIAGLALISAIFILLLPFAAVAGIRSGVRRYYEEQAQRKATQLRPLSESPRTRSE